MNEENEEKIVPSYALDLIVEQHKSEKKKLWIALAVVFLAFLITNAFWINREFQYEDEVITATQTITQDSGEGGTNTYTGDFYGTTNDNPNNNKEAESP